MWALVTAAAIATSVAWCPQPGPQNAAMLCPTEDLFFGGQRGGGKTDFLLGDWAYHASLHGRHARGVLFRRTYPELAEVIERAKDIYPRLGARYNETHHNWTFPNGAILRLRYLRQDKDADGYQGHGYTWQGWDEIGNFPSPRPMDKLWATLRSAHGIPCVRRLTGNPGGPGHAWVKRRYINHAPPMQPFRWQPQPVLQPNLWIESVFIPSRLEDNVLLMQNDPDYESRIAAATAGNDTLWRAWRHGDWNVTAGVALEQLNASVHFLRPFAVPPYWQMFGSLDWGYAHRWVFVWYAVNEDGDVFFVDTVHGRKHLPPVIAERIVSRAPMGRLRYIVAGLDVFEERKARGENTPTLHEQFTAAGLTGLTRANVSRKFGLNNMRRYFAWRGTGPNRTDDTPRARFMDTPGNRWLFEQLESIVTDPDDPEDALKVDCDEDTGEGGDDGYDSARYGLASRPIVPKSPWEKQVVSAFAPEVLAHEAKESRKVKARRRPRGPAPDAVT